MSDSVCVGVDIAKDKFDVYFESESSKPFKRCFNNNATGHRASLRWIHKYIAQPWVCMEATGHYSEGLADYLFNANVKVSVVNPLQIKCFTKACLARNKNDVIDAKYIALYAKTMKPREYQPKP